MIIDLKALRQKGIKSQRFEFSYLPDGELLSLPDAKFHDDVKVEGVVEVYDDEAYVSGKITYGIDASCSRCLAPTTKFFEIEFDEKFVSEQALRADEDCLIYKKDKIELIPTVNELIMTDMPYAVYCKDDCRGLCPNCGKNLNDGACGCEIL